MTYFQNNNENDTDILARAPEEETFEKRKPIGMARSREETLADWLGDERASDVMADMRPIKAIAPLVKTILSTNVNEDIYVLHMLQEHWNEILTADLAGQCAPLSVRGDTLRIEVKNATMLYMLKRVKSADILNTLSSYTKGALKHVEFVPMGLRRAEKPSTAQH